MTIQNFFAGWNTTPVPFTHSMFCFWGKLLELKFDIIAMMSGKRLIRFVRQLLSREFSCVIWNDFLVDIQINIEKKSIKDNKWQSWSLCLPASIRKEQLDVKRLVEEKMKRKTSPGNLMKLFCFSSIPFAHFAVVPQPLGISISNHQWIEAVIIPNTRLHLLRLKRLFTQIERTTIKRKCINRVHENIPRWLN